MKDFEHQHILNKTWSRIKLIGFGSIYKATSQFFSILLSYIVIRWHSDELWGTYVQYLLLVQLASQILAWGSGDYVLREFSRFPNCLAEIWQTAVASRSSLLLPILLALYFTPFPLTGKLLLAAWVIADFLCGLFGSVVIYLRSFKAGTIIELSGHALILLGVLLIKPLNAYAFIALFVSAQLLKATCFAWRFRKQLFQQFNPMIDWRFLQDSFPFLLVGLIALAQTKVDMYLVAFFLEKSDLGQYHIIMRWMSLGHLGLTFILMPYLQSFYRLPKSAVNKLIKRIFGIGVGISILHLLALWLVFTHIYHFQLSPMFYLVILVHLLPFYAYYLKIYDFFKRDQQQVLLVFYSSFALISTLLSYYFIPKLGILGALITSTIIQYGLLVAFFIIEPWYVKSTTR